MKAKAPEQTDELNVSISEKDEVSDPFAVDLFATSRVSVETDEDLAATDSLTELVAEPSGPVEVRWHARLPRVTLVEARRSSSIARLPAPLRTDNIEALIRTIARYMHVPPEAVSLALVDLREAEFEAALQRTSGETSVFASLIVEPFAAPITVELDTGFAAALVDRMLSGVGAPPDVLRALSVAEQACLEFLCLSIVSELNGLISEPVIKLDEVRANPPSWFFGSTLKPQDATLVAAPNAAAATNYGLVLVARIQVDAVIGYARVYLGSDTLASLNANENPLLSAHSAWRDAGERVGSMKRVASTIALSVVIGRTEIAGEDLAYLERGDVVVIAQPEARWMDGEFRGKLRIRVGSGHTNQTLAIIGSADVAAKLDVAHRKRIQIGKAGTIKLVTEAVVGGDTRPEAERLKMEEEAANEEAAEEAGVEFGGLLLTVHVELAARRIRLDELAQLRPGQIIDLGCKATDPVELVTEERRIARGELVDIEGRLGVRITRVFA